MKSKTPCVLGSSLLFNVFFTFCVSKDDLRELDVFEQSTHVPIEIKKHLNENSSVYDIYRLGITFKKQSKFGYKNREMMLFSIKCFQFIIDKYRDQLPLHNRKLKKILGNSYYQVAKFSYKIGDKEHAFINFLMAKDLGGNTSKYTEKMDEEDILRTIYKTGSFFYKKEVNLESKITHKNFDIARECFEYVIARCNSLIDASTDEGDSRKRLNSKILTKSYYQLAMLGFKLGKYHFAEKQLKSAIILGSDEAIRFVMSREWIDKRAFPYFKSCY